MMFDLTRESWIPCLMMTGETIDLGPEEVFERAHEIVEVSGETPPITAALHRLLITIARRSMGGPEEPEEKVELLKGGRFGKEPKAYLKKTRDRFDLLHPTNPFYQIGGLTTGKMKGETYVQHEPHPINHIMIGRPSGHNPALFDHTTDADRIRIPLAEAARHLVAYQSYHSGFGLTSSYKTPLDDVLRNNKSYTDSPLTRGYCIFLRGRNLFETIILNLPAGKIVEGDVPSWELDQKELIEMAVRAASGGLINMGEMDLFTWPTRFVRIVSDGEMAAEVFVTNGVHLNKAVEDPMKAYRSTPLGMRPCSPSMDRAMWRDLGPLLVESDVDDPKPKYRNPVIIGHFRTLGRLIEELPRDIRISISAIGIIMESGKASSIIEWREEKMPFPVEVLRDEGTMKVVLDAIRLADDASQKLRSIIMTVAKRRLGKTASAEAMWKAGGSSRVFWTMLDSRFATFATLISKIETDEDEKEAKEYWWLMVAEAIEKAYGSFVNSIGNDTRTLMAIGSSKSWINNAVMNIRRDGKMATDKGGLTHDQGSDEGVEG